MLSAHTLGKVHIFGSDTVTWRAELAKSIHHSQLPSAYGGSNTTQHNYHSRHGEEWLPRADFFEDSLFETTVIAAGDKFVKTFNLESGTRIR